MMGPEPEFDTTTKRANGRPLFGSTTMPATRTAEIYRVAA